jgi:hypothetical protein
VARNPSDLKIVISHVLDTLREIISLTRASSELNENVSVEFLCTCNEIISHNATMVKSLSYLLLKTRMLIDDKTKTMDRNSQKSTHFDPSLHIAFDQSWKVSNKVVPELEIRKQIKVESITLKKPFLRSLDCRSGSGSTDTTFQSQDYGFFDEDSISSDMF